MAKYSTGAISFYRVRSGLQPMLPDQIKEIAARHQIPESIIPKYSGDRATVSRAISAVASQVSRSGWLLRPLKQEKTNVVHAIVEETKDAEKETVELAQQSNLQWSLAQDGGDQVHGSHGIAQQVDVAYQALRGKIVGADWTATLTDYLIAHCMATPMRDDGRVYWLPPNHIPQAHILRGFLDEVGIGLMLCEIETETKVIIQEAVQETLGQKIKELTDEVDAFDGTQRAGTYKERLSEYHDLRRRAITYRDVLGIGVEDAQRALTVLEEKVQDLLLTRQQTTIHKDGTTTVVERDYEAPTFEPEAAAF